MCKVPDSTGASIAYGISVISMGLSLILSELECLYTLSINLFQAIPTFQCIHFTDDMDHWQQCMAIIF